MVSYILMCRISAINMNVIGDAKVGGCGVRVDPIESSKWSLNPSCNGWLFVYLLIFRMIQFKILQIFQDFSRMVGLISFWKNIVDFKHIHKESKGYVYSEQLLNQNHQQHFLLSPLSKVIPCVPSMHQLFWRRWTFRNQWSRWTSWNQWSWMGFLGRRLTDA